jgi:hypothetical protein
MLSFVCGWLNVQNNQTAKPTPVIVIDQTVVIFLSTNENVHV